MDSLCDNVDLFVEGELSLEEADKFRLHLPDCLRCQHELAELMQLKVLARRLPQPAAPLKLAPRVRAAPRRRWSYRVLAPAAAFAAVLAVVVVVGQRSQPSLQGDVWLSAGSQRLLEARVSAPGADRHRPLASKMMGGPGSTQELPLEDLAVLKKHDPKGLVAAYLVRDEQGLAEQALRELQEMAPSADRDSDRAVAKLLKGESEAALRLADAALAQAPHHPQALWNRALALRDLGLPLLAARTFTEVAALREPGWAEEAARKAEALQRVTFERLAQWKAVSGAEQTLLDAAPGLLPEDFSRSPSARRIFYDAVRAAPSRERVLALLPMAQKLDAQAGGSVLEAYVRRTSEADFSRRAPLARDYVALIKGQLSAAEKERFLEQVLKSKEDDILLGALVWTGSTARYLELYEAKAAASGDSWFQLLAAQERAKVDIAAGRWRHAAQILADARRRCASHGLEYRCHVLDLELSSLYIKLQQTDLARLHAVRGWKEAGASSEWGLESSLLWNLAQVARFGSDVPLARAYLGEFLERDRDNPDTQRRVHQDLAIMAMQNLQVDEARKEMDAALTTGVPLGLSGTIALADIARLKSAPGDEAHLTQALEKLKPWLSPGERALTTQTLGRFFIERDVERGRSLLWRAIEEAGAPGLEEDQGAQEARAYSFNLLLLEAGRRQAFQEALELFERERGMALPRRCLLAATVDSERTLLIALGNSRELVGHFDQARRQPLSQRLEGLVPESLLTALRGCPQVEVLARPPLHGRAGLLPGDMAWSYLTRTSDSKTRQREGPAVHLVVSDVDLPPQASLKRLNAWTPSFGPQEKSITLSGASATPSRVLSAMREATEIDLVTHGIINGDADASYLLLAPEQERSELGSSEVRAASLQGAPFVVLAACHAAYTTYSLDVPFSLPAAFIQAGARGVLAATVEIPDLEAGMFFNAIREHIRSGMAPALALRQERVRWRQEGRGTQWIDSVLLFE